MDNPCRECEFRRMPKNIPQCENCRDRIVYVNKLGTYPSALPSVKASQFKDKPRPKPLPPKPKPKPTHPTCSHPGCENKIVARGLCRLHYDRLLASEKKSMDGSREPSRSWGETCFWAGCDKPVFSCGLCASHYHKRRDKTLFKHINLPLMTTVELSEVASARGMDPQKALENLVIIGLKYLRERSAA
jgi:hypothetical protein